MECSADRSLWPFPWLQRKSFTPEALYIVGSCNEKRYCLIFMSSPARTEGYYTPAQRTFMVAKVRLMQTRAFCCVRPQTAFSLKECYYWAFYLSI